MRKTSPRSRGAAVRRSGITGPRPSVVEYFACARSHSCFHFMSVLLTFQAQTGTDSQFWRNIMSEADQNRATYDNLTQGDSNGWQLRRPRWKNLARWQIGGMA